MHRLSRFLFWLIALPLAALLVVFALSNRQTVTLGLWPLADGVEFPVYVTVLVPLLAGLVIGLLTGAARRLAAQAKALSLARRVAALQSALDTATASSSPTPRLSAEETPLP